MPTKVNTYKLRHFRRNEKWFIQWLKKITNDTLRVINHSVCCLANYLLRYNCCKCLERRPNNRGRVSPDVMWIGNTIYNLTKKVISASYFWHYEVIFDIFLRVVRFFKSNAKVFLNLMFLIIHLSPCHNFFVPSYLFSVFLTQCSIIPRCKIHASL